MITLTPTLPPVQAIDASQTTSARKLEWPSELPPPEPQGQCERSRLATGSLAGGETAEAYFIDRDIFLIYVEDKVNSARAESGLDTISRAAASHLFDVIDSRRYRLPSGKQENAEVQRRPAS